MKELDNLGDDFRQADYVREAGTAQIILSRAAQQAKENRQLHLDDVYAPALRTVIERIQRLPEYKDYLEAVDNLAQHDDSLRAHSIVPEAVMGISFNAPLVPAPMEFKQSEKLTKKYFRRSRGEFAPSRIMRALKEMGCGSPSDINRFCRVKQKHLPAINPSTLKSALKAMCERGILERNSGVYRIIDDTIK